MTTADDLTEREADANALQGYRDHVANLEAENQRLQLAWSDDQGHRDAILERAEARVDQLTDQLALTQDTLRRRGEAVNATGASNDQLRAKVARVEKLADKWIAGYGYEDDSTLAMAACGDRIRAALADQETP